MKNFSVLLCVVLFNFSNLFFTSSADFNYEHLKYSDPNLSIHVLKIHPQKYTISIASAEIENGYLAQKTTTIAEKHHAVAAINGSFWDLGEPNQIKKQLLLVLRCLGINAYNTFSNCVLKIRDDWESLSSFKAGFIAWNNKDTSKIIIDNLVSDWTFQVDDIFLPIKDINKPFADGPILYTKKYGSKIPINTNSIEIIIKNNTVNEITFGGNIDIPENGYVYSTIVTPEFLKIAESLLRKTIIINKNCISSSSEQLKNMEYIVGSYPILIKNNQIEEDIYTNLDIFYTNKHPRTAIGITTNNEWIFVVVDGRQQHSVGMTMLELAEFMKEIGCVNGLNLDGGGSSTMVINNKIVNSPSGNTYALPQARNQERPVNSVFLVHSRNN